ncbi:MAG: hypothetical protein QNJ40_08335 [Xanthomonadales bacterium]|nr:hypothetical protein [Xanthomonadales bacterium]
MSDRQNQKQKPTPEADVPPPIRQDPEAALDFSIAVEDNGYAWWYLDAVSDDGVYGLTLIVFIGSVFSPYYATARRLGSASPENHCAMNAILYGPGVGRWSMTERGRGSLSRDSHHLAIGPSRIDWDGQRLVAQIEEVTAPLPRRLRGSITLDPQILYAPWFTLDSREDHQWVPIAPRSRVRVEFQNPALAFDGHAYFDSNRGRVPLEQSFERWNWCRTLHGRRVLYDVTDRYGGGAHLSLGFGDDGRARHVPMPPTAELPVTTWWRIARPTHSDNGQARLLRTLVDAPFYSRSEVGLELDGEAVTAVHESIELNRFANPLVQYLLLPFRTPRRFF